MAPDYCENCGAASRFTGRFSGADVGECGRCRGWRWQGPTGDAEALYDRDYFFGGEYLDYEVAERAQAWNFRRKLRLLARAGAPVGPGTRLLEIGCATGGFLRVARDAGVVRALGVEVSGYGRDAARAAGFDVAAPTDADLDARVRALGPDLVVAWDVWEHLPRPASTLDRYLALAAPGCAVALTTLDASSAVARLRGRRWRQFHPPTHLSYPTRASLRRYFEDRGFAVRAQRAFGYFRPVLEYAGALGLAVPARRLAALPVYLNLFDIQLVIAVRP